MPVLELLNLGENLEVFLGIFELLSPNGNRIVKPSLQSLLSTVDLIKLVIDLLLDALPLVVLLIRLLVQLLLSRLDLHESAGILVVVLLQLL